MKWDSQVPVERVTFGVERFRALALEIQVGCFQVAEREIERRIRYVHCETDDFVSEFDAAGQTNRVHRGNKFDEVIAEPPCCRHHLGVSAQSFVPPTVLKSQCRPAL